MAMPDIVRPLQGAWRLASLNPQGAEAFDVSASGFWRSFWAAAVAAPIFALLTMLERRMTEAAVGGMYQMDITFGSYYLHAAVTYVLIWPVFAFVAWYALKALRAERGFSAAVVAMNWTRVIAMAMRLPVTALGAVGALSPVFLMFALMATVGLVIYYQWFAVRAGLALVDVGQPGRVATVIIAADIGVTFLLSWFSSLFIGAPVEVLETAPH
jgi:hypothetical protein